jgi:hypothetical protein
VIFRSRPTSNLVVLTGNIGEFREPKGDTAPRSPPADTKRREAQGGHTKGAPGREPQFPQPHRRESSKHRPPSTPLLSPVDGNIETRPAKPAGQPVLAATRHDYRTPLPLSIASARNPDPSARRSNPLSPFVGTTTVALWPVLSLLTRGRAPLPESRGRADSDPPAENRAAMSVGHPMTTASLAL